MELGLDMLMRQSFADQCGLMLVDHCYIGPAVDNSDNFHEVVDLWLGIRLYQRSLALGSLGLLCRDLGSLYLRWPGVYLVKLDQS